MIIIMLYNVKYDESNFQFLFFGFCFLLEEEKMGVKIKRRNGMMLWTCRMFFVATFVEL